ncbi:LysE family translocator [Variovorax terrae]|uniref:LysE family translocator n=1 Tax=Variovorax terrae TaxID=2923278 RepID=A0A9X1W5F9_9BURK|nr:LysE family translocator [Variovorax terrae]MCJ0766088.1 LysE family translocator [Variovorax terrae]
MGIDHLLLFIAAGLLLNLTPGPDVLYIVTHALRRGARAGVVAAFGITAGCFVHIGAAAIGVSALMAASATAFTVLKWAGAAYLVWVGVRMLLSRQSPDAIDFVASNDPPARTLGLKTIFFQGFWTNALNPKVALFFLAFLPQFIAPGAEHKALSFLLLGLLFNFNGLWVNIGWALVAAWAAARVGAVRRGMHWLERAAGALFIGFGLKLALSDAPGTASGI